MLGTTFLGTDANAWQMQEGGVLYIIIGSCVSKNFENKIVVLTTNEIQYIQLMCRSCYLLYILPAGPT